MRLLVILFLFFLSACKASLDVGKGEIGSESDFSGCIDGVALDTSRIRINFEHPEVADKVNVYRDGILITSSTTSNNTSYIDTDLNEGQTYLYECEVVIGNKGHVGLKTLQISTITFNAPTFNGIFNAIAVSPNIIRVTWNPALPTGVPAASYKVYGNLGGTVDWTAAPDFTATSEGTFFVQLGERGDELSYVYGVRACSNADICDTNMVQQTVNLVDGGPPKTNGVISAQIVNSKIELTVPWKESDGAVLNRKVYQKTGGTATSNLGDYALVLTEFSSDINNPKTKILIGGIAENTTYHYIVQDEDPTGNNNGNLNTVTMTTGDLNAPTFAGISSLSLGGNVEEELVIGFNAINRQNSVENDSNGASHYQVYLTSAAYPSSPSDPCLQSIPYLEEASDTHAPGATTITLTGLNPRMTYRACVKARDNAGNISSNIENLSRTTLDVTPPSFAGIQTMAFDSNDREVDVTWNPSTSPDIKEYKVQLWVNTTAPTAPQITNFLFPHGTHPSGESFDQVQYAFVDNDDVYGIVDACDDANTLPGGSQNCTSFALSTYKTVYVPDITPPAGFLGIRSSADQDSLVEGQLTVKWFEPTWTPDYYGFKVYSVDSGNNLSFMADCPCAIPGSCNSGDIQCNINGLEPFRTYKLHVRAYDQFGNLTDYLDPAINFASKRVLDSTAPTFASGLTIGAGPTFPLNWTSATDNQYSLEPGAVINYDVYSKNATTFADAFNPQNDGALKTTTTNTNFTDSGIIEGQTFYYTVCAKDGTGNRTCDGNVQTLVVPDITPPTLTNFASNHDKRKKKWDLSWSMNDNITPPSNLVVTIYEKISDSESSATTADPVVFSGTGDLIKTDMIGPLNANKWVNYLIKVQDQVGNSATASLSLYSENVITLTSIKRNSGATAGGKYIVLTGTGFSFGDDNGYGADTTVSLDGGSCAWEELAHETKLSCETPAHTAGFVNVTVTNPEGSSATIFNGYEYTNSNAHICDDAGSWGPDFAAGTGTALDPFIICDDTHLDMLRNNLGENGALDNYRTGSKFFELKDNIDLDGIPFVKIPSFTGTIGGEGHGIFNLTRNYGGANNNGLFEHLSSATINNLGVVNVNISNTGIETGALAATMSGTTVDGVFVTGLIDGSGSSTIGGVYGRGTGTNTHLNSFAKATVNGAMKVGGFAGEGKGNFDGCGFRGTVVADDVTTGVGGLVGALNSSNIHYIKNSWAIANISVLGTGNGTYIGGLVGDIVANNYVEDVWTEGSINAPDSNFVGGILGELQAFQRLERAYAKVDVVGDEYVGGIIGYAGLCKTIDLTAEGNVTGRVRVGGLIGYFLGGVAGQGVLRGAAKGDITAVGASDSIGGLIGNTQPGGGHNPNIYFSSATGNVNGSVTTTSRIGGLIGYHVGSGSIIIEDSYATGSVTGNADVAAFIGRLDSPNSGLTSIQRNYATGAVNGTTRIAAFFGRCYSCDSSTWTIQDNFWDLDVTGMTDAYYSDGTPILSGDTGMFGKTTAEMQDQVLDIYGNSTWDFSTPIWKWPSASGVYPILDWQP